MHGDIHVRNVKVFENLLSSLDQFERACAIAVSEKDQALNSTMQTLKEKKYATENRINTWRQEADYWAQRIYVTDQDGHRTIDPAAQKMQLDAQGKMKKCEALKQAAQMHMDILNNRTRVTILSGVSGNVSNAKQYLQELSKQIAAYGVLDLTSAIGVGSSGLSGQMFGHSTAQQEEPLKYKVSESKRKEIEFEGHKISQTEIDWNAVYHGKTNLEHALSGNAPFSSDGKKIELHHVGQDYCGSFAEVPKYLHHSKQYNLHGVYPGRISFRNDPALNNAYNAFRARYWIYRASVYRNGG